MTLGYFDSGNTHDIPEVMQETAASRFSGIRDCRLSPCDYDCDGEEYKCERGSGARADGVSGSFKAGARRHGPEPRVV